MLQHVFSFSIVKGVFIMLSKRFDTIKSSIAILATVCIVAILFTSVFFLTFHHNHDCIGDTCPICLQIERCARFFEHLFSLGLLVYGIYQPLNFSKLSKGGFLRSNTKRTITPIHTKVQLNN